jgi:magnesium-transporting ATPase (P-type)
VRKNVQAGEADSEIIGDPLEILMFDMTGWHLHEPRVVPGQSKVGLNTHVHTHTVLIPDYHDHHRHVPAAELAVHPVIPKVSILNGNHQATCFAMIRQFTFSSALQRMAVIVGATDGQSYEGPLFIYAKVPVASAVRSHLTPS